MHFTQWLLQCVGLLYLVHTCQSQTMDEILAGAMTSPNGFDFIFDDATKTIRAEIDILYSKEEWDMLQMLNLSSIGMPGKRQAIKDGAGGQKWSGQTVPYEIDERAFGSDSARKVLHDAMNDWMKYTCINFRPAHAADKHKIRFVDGDGCASYVGMQSNSKQDVLLASGCRHKGTVIHELGHALGLHHEQTRPDRDEFVKINYDNIPDHLEYNFKKYSWSVIADVGVPYDYTSIMHYGKTYFAEDKSKATIETNDQSAQDVIGNRVGLSFRDIKTINKVYECKAQNCGLRDENCKGEGFVGMDCTCWCPASVSRDSDPYVRCDQTSDSGIQGSGWTGSGTGSTSTGSITGSLLCEDQNTKCSMWASQGHCSTSQTYMNSFCKKSCNRCGTILDQCQDLHEMCAYWAGRGYCTVGYVSFMEMTCKRSCSKCGGSFLDPLTSTVCRDENEYCSAWASMNYCSNPEYMEYMTLTCKSSCNLCPTSVIRPQLSYPGRWYRK